MSFESSDLCLDGNLRGYNWACDSDWMYSADRSDLAWSMSYIDFGDGFWWAARFNLILFKFKQSFVLNICWTSEIGFGTLLHFWHECYQLRM